MPLLQSFTIFGLAGRSEPFACELNEDVNVFYGFNGSGKTSLLRILHSALANDASLLRDVPFSAAQVNIYSYAEETSFTFFLAKFESPEQRVLLDQGSGEHSHGASRLKKREKLTWEIFPKPKLEGGYFHKYLPTSRLYTGAKVQSSNFYFGGEKQSTEEELESVFAENLQKLWNEYSADILRRVQAAQQKGLTNILKSVLWSIESSSEPTNIDPGEAYKYVSEFLRRQAGAVEILGSEDQFIERYKNESQLRSVVKDIQKVEREIATATAPSEDFRKLVNEMFGQGKTLSFSEDKLEIEISDGEANKTAINLTGLSSGEKQLLKIFVDALGSASSVILVDEPELSMHVDWQRRLVRSLQLLAPRTQIVLATHSPEVMADLPDSQIFRI
jgi:predicted ATP-dependent endonuclease of OLD family